MTCEHGPIEYETLHVPDSYHCGKCGALGVRLWRQSHTFADSVQLRCSACKAEDDVPAVPTPDGSTYWGCSSVPSGGDAWWRALPLEPGQPRSAFCLDPELVEYEAQAAAALKRDAWVAKQWPNVPRTDADNFHNCIQAVRG